MANRYVRFLTGAMAAVCASGALPTTASAYELWLAGIYCTSEANHSLGSDSDETFVIVTIFDNNTGELLAGPLLLPRTADDEPTYWTDVDAGEFRDYYYDIWSGGARDLFIDTQVWEYDSHAANALRVLVSINIALGVSLMTANPVYGAGAGVAADMVAQRMLEDLESADHDFMGRATTVILGSDMEAWARESHYYDHNDAGERLEYDFSVETAGHGAKYVVYFDIF